ncbi:MAG TPA: FAD-binding protein [Elusimicrobiales bacterium]|nr:FAD-binding protein [Elusimicrobiales bacterium]
MKVIKTDCLVIGSGLAGSIYAITAAKYGLKSIIISCQDKLEDTNTWLAQGGVIYEYPPETEQITNDVYNAGAKLSSKDVVKKITKVGYKYLKQILLDELKVPFDRDKKGKLLVTKEGAHSKARVIYAKDNTGEVILDTVHKKLKNLKNVTHMTNAMAIDLLTLSHSSTDELDRYKPSTCFGAYVLDVKKGEIFAITAKKTILATGGAGQIYTHTTNAPSAFGHGVAMAYRIGARVMNMEFIQFHPTVFYDKGNEGFVITEAVRGEGGVLVDSNGKSFMEKYHELKSLAPRDVISRAIHSEMLKSGNTNVFIDLSAMKPDYIKKRFPHIYKRCLKHKVDITKDPIPVVPAVHYMCGGVFASPEGRTSINDLNAIGETACTGYHGANRLASTSLLECIAMGAMCAQEDSTEIKTHKFYLPKPKEWLSPKIAPDVDLIAQDLQIIRNTMTNYVGVVRSRKRLERAEKLLRELKNQIDDFYRECTITREIINLRNAIQTSLLVVYAALRNTVSCGCHYIDDEQK